MNSYCSLENRLLRRIIDKKVHWNNLETSAHIHFKRVPNKMDPGALTIMNFHL